MMRLSSTFVSMFALVSLVAQLPAAQAPADSAVHAVAYVEVSPASKASALAAFKAYRAAAAKEDGYVSVQVFEQTGRQAHFTILEAWKDQKVTDAHLVAASRKALMAALEPSRLSDYDQRPYKTLSVGIGAAPGAQTVYVISHVDTAPPPPNAGPSAGPDGPGLLRRLAESSRLEPGCLQFDVLQHAMRGNHFTVIEAWQNDAALERHAAAAHTKAYREAIAPLLGSPLDERIFKAVP
jgi:quinol monooxygenase YgiN